MERQRRPTESHDKDAGSASVAESETPMGRFKSLATKLVKVTRDELQAAKRAEDRAKQGS